jgi:hypothetical protein
MESLEKDELQKDSREFLRFQSIPRSSERQNSEQNS